MQAAKIPLGASVYLVMTKKLGVVIGAATYLEHAPQVLVRHVDAQGDQVEKWYDESAVSQEPV